MKSNIFLKKYLIILINFFFAITVFLSIVFYVQREKIFQNQKSKDSFIRNAATLADISYNYINASKQVIQYWKLFLENDESSFEDVFDKLVGFNSLGKYSCHLIWADTLKGLSTEPMAQDPTCHEIDYKKYGYHHLFDECLKSDDIFVTSRYANPMDGDLVIAFFTKIKIKNNNIMKDAILIRIFSEASIKQTWSFPTEYGENVTAGLMNTDGTYIIKPSYMQNTSFYKYIIYYNPTLYSPSELINKIKDTQEGFFYAKNSKEQECFWTFNHITNNDDWVFFTSIPTECFSSQKINLIIPVIIFISMTFIIIFDSIIYTKIRKDEEKSNKDLLERNSVIATLAYDFKALFLIEPDNDEYFLYYSRKNSFKDIRLVPNNGKYSEKIQVYINNYVVEEDRAEFLKATTIAALQKNVPKEGLYNMNYRRIFEGKIDHYQFSVAKIGDKYSAKKFVMGFRNISDTVNKEMEQERLLREALVTAENANRSKTIFLNNMSHDIRTPMNAIIGFTSLAQKNISDKEMTQEYLKKITTSSNHLLSLINDILDMSRIESGKVSIEEKEIYLPDIFYDLQTILLSEMNSKEIHFEIDFSKIKNEFVWGDKLRLNQIFLNLLSNAIKYTMPGGKVKLTITQKEECEVGYGHYEFSVKDNGIGMSKEFLSHIYEPFVREKSSTVSGIQGTGLGLCITKNMVDMMGGNISVTSEQGKGTEFVVSIIFKLVESTIPDSTGETKKYVNINFKGKTILLVEDNELNQEIAKEILKEFGFKIIVVDDGDIAVEFMRNVSKNEIDLIMMDIQMPRMDGYTATREIRTLANQEASNVPIVAMTANAFEEDRKKAFESGMNGHIAKPFDIGQMLNVLNGILS